MKVHEIEQKYVAMGMGTEGSQQKVPDARKVRGSQDTMRIKLAEIFNNGENTCSDPIQSFAVYRKHMSVTTTDTTSV